MPKRGIMHEKQQQQPKNLPKRDEIRDETKSIKTLIPNKYIYTYFQYSTNILFSKFQCEHWSWSWWIKNWSRRWLYRWLPQIFSRFPAFSTRNLLKIYFTKTYCGGISHRDNASVSVKFTISFSHTSGVYQATKYIHIQHTLYLYAKITEYEKNQHWIEAVCALCSAGSSFLVVFFMLLISSF